MEEVKTDDFNPEDFMNLPITFVKLKTGENIVAMVKTVDNKEKPFQFLVSPKQIHEVQAQNGESTMFVLLDWVPSILVAANIFMIFNEDILTMISASPKLVEYYIRVLEKDSERLLAKVNQANTIGKSKSTANVFDDSYSEVIH